MIFTLNMNLFHLRNSFSFTPCSSVETIQYLFQRTTTRLGTIPVFIYSSKHFFKIINHVFGETPPKPVLWLTLAKKRVAIRVRIYLQYPLHVAKRV